MTAPRTTPGKTRKTVYRVVARLRNDDARVLLDNKRNNGAIYLAGYAIECQLKYALCQRKNLLELPEELETHDWDRLVTSAGLLEDIKLQPDIYVVYSALTRVWGPSLRYRTGNYSENQAKLLYNQMNQLYKFLERMVI